MASSDGITKMVSPRTGAVTWRARISYTDEHGRRRHRSRTFRTRAAAVKWRRGQLADRDRGELHEPAVVTVAEVAARWLATVDRSRAPSTAMHYRGWYERVVAPAFGARQIGSVTAPQVQAFYDDLATRYAGGTVAHIHKLLRGIFGFAVTDGLIRVDPTAGRRVPKDRRRRATVLTADEARRFLDAAAADPYGPVLLLLATTGLRLGEALALHWEDVDLAARTLRVQRTAQRGRGGWRIADRPKTASSNRTVVLPSRAVRMLAALPRTGPLVFPHPRDGGLLADDAIRRAVERVCRAAAVPSVTPHDLRRTAATLLLAEGVHVKIAAAMLGHSVEMMLRLYAQVSTDLQDVAADALDRALGDAGASKSRPRDDD